MPKKVLNIASNIAPKFAWQIDEGNALEMLGNVMDNALRSGPSWRRVSCELVTAITTDAARASGETH